MADHCRVLEVFRTMFIQLQEHVLCMKAPSMYGVTPTSALGVYKAKILILNGIIKKMDESEFSLIISIEPLGASCCQPQSLTEKVQALSLPLPAHGLALNLKCLSLPSR